MSRWDYAIHKSSFSELSYLAFSQNSLSNSPRFASLAYSYFVYISNHIKMTDKILCVPFKCIHVLGRERVNLFKSTVTFNGKCSVFNNSSGQHGGGIYARNSNISFKEECSVFNNMAAKNGGGMSVEYSNIIFQRLLLFFNNSAHKDGGGILWSTAC